MQPCARLSFHGSERSVISTRPIRSPSLYPALNRLKLRCYGSEACPCVGRCIVDVNTSGRTYTDLKKMEEATQLTYL